MSALTSNKPDGPINKFKLNATLYGITKIIADDRPLPDFNHESPQTRVPHLSRPLRKVGIDEVSTARRCASSRWIPCNVPS